MKSVPRKEISLAPQHVATVAWRKEKPRTPQNIGLQTCEEEMQKTKVAEDTQDYNRKGVLIQHHHSRHVLRGCAPRQDRGTAVASDTSGGRSRFIGTQGPGGLTPNVNSRKQVIQFRPQI
jgi:hypothetical protein